MELKTPSRMIVETLDDPSASFWLKDALRALCQRDPVDAAADAEYLSRLMTARCAEILNAAERP